MRRSISLGLLACLALADAIDGQVLRPEEATQHAPLPSSGTIHILAAYRWT